jgi:transposase
MAYPSALVDGLPIRVCKPIRHGRVRLLHEEGAYFGKGSTGWFFGFKLHALVHHDGLIVSALLTPANFDEREAALALALSVDGGLVLGDLGYRSRQDWLGETLAEEADLLLIHPADAGDKHSPRRALVSSLRERVETSFSSLWQRFIDRNLSRSWQGLWSTLKLKMLHFNLCRAGFLPA